MIAHRKGSKRYSLTFGAPLMLALVAAAGSAQDADPSPVLETVIVTASRSDQNGEMLPSAWVALSEDTIALVAPQHSNQLFNRVSGAWVSRGNGQESLISLRSPVLTGAGSCGAFMTAQDGISLRAPGFCNVNQLFDANLLQAGGVEVLKGPAGVVFGSNALHGIVNVITRSVSSTPNQLSVEAGSRDYYRLAASGATETVAVAAQTSRYGGYQADSGYRQHKATLRLDHHYADWILDGVLEASELDQETAGYIQGYESYKDEQASKENPNPEAYRDAWSARGHLGFRRSFGDASDITIRPYWRSNGMTFLQHFLPWKATEENRHHSVGVQTSATFVHDDLRWLLGVDLDTTTGKLLETQKEFFSPNQPDGTHYDYEVDARTAATFAQLSWGFASSWTLEAGLRFEETRYDYTNNASDGAACAPTASACRFYRPASRKDSFADWTGNIALSHRSDTTTVYGRVARGFRVPQAAELYRLQSGQTVAEIDAETGDSIEFGLRHHAGPIRYDLSGYLMTKRDVIFQDRDRYNVSGAKTTHRGIEGSLSWQLSDIWSVTGNASYARHRYDSDIQLLGSQGSIEGYDIDTAPKHFGSVQVAADLSSAGLPVRAEAEWVWVAKYWVDPNNQHEYRGHDLVNLRVSWQLSPSAKLSLVTTNLLDKGYAERADFGFGNYRYFVGEPRSAVLGITFSL
ncbi:MAG: TonB-dependent receptor [Luminiphilus sp.]